MKMSYHKAIMSLSSGISKAIENNKKQQKKQIFPDSNHNLSCFDKKRSKCWRDFYKINEALVAFGIGELEHSLLKLV